MKHELNRRVFPRSLTDERAEIQLAEGRVRCVVRDRSSNGARLVFRTAMELPAQFSLHDRHRSSLVELVWFDGLQAGVRFTPSTP